ncbi:hypothetical protein A2242_01680 [Candidatus Falkowbacteria bacterium RIFOXYA2_FULL_47_9]|uniref:Uncharacterized protein n=1 Tax=Candidatus Falkowbacteria bacterium RIFOXYA2_FULL_47_9 TaxID=1797995 RepID=A0A1F5SJD6_9BACT|nr:MAG: hypothetical protein A2242_01680 [Candidatus Falkowbacteria bacterium RIFOXYA2_FULL_47_9]
MAKNNNNNPVTKKELGEVLGTFAEDVLLPAVERIVDEKIYQKLAKHTHEMKDYIDSKLADQKGDIIEYIKGEHTNEMKKYIDSTLDSKLANQKGDIIAVIKGDRERDNNWKLKVVEILKRNKLANPKELELLTDFVR